MWSIANRSTLTIAQPVGLLNLPSLTSIISNPRLLLFIEVPFLIAGILALPFISIFGPAAMVSFIAKPRIANVSVPTIDLSRDYQYYQSLDLVHVLVNEP
jgi:hypothetical protein